MVAREVWKNPYLFYHDVKYFDKQRNTSDFKNLVRSQIEESIRFMLPVKHILKEYIDNNASDDLSIEINRIHEENLKSLVNNDLQSASIKHEDNESRIILENQNGGDSVPSVPCNSQESDMSNNIIQLDVTENFDSKSNVSDVNLQAEPIKLSESENVLEEPVAEEPVTEEPVTEEPVTEEPVTEEPVIEEPVTEEPVTEEPVTEEPSPVEELVEEHVTEQHVEEPVLVVEETAPLVEEASPAVVEVEKPVEEHVEEPIEELVNKQDTVVGGSDSYPDTIANVANALVEEPVEKYVPVVEQSTPVVEESVLEKSEQLEAEAVVLENDETKQVKTVDSDTSIVKDKDIEMVKKDIKKNLEEKNNEIYDEDDSLQNSYDTEVNIDLYKALKNRNRFLSKSLEESLDAGSRNK